MFESTLAILKGIQLFDVIEERQYDGLTLYDHEVMQL